MPRRHKWKNRYAAQRTYGGGNTKNRRSKGSRGGVGRAGYHKHKWMRTIKYENAGRGLKAGFHNPTTRRYSEVSLEEIQRGIDHGKFQKDASGAFAIDLSGSTKVLGSGNISSKAVIKAGKFSESAKKKIQSASGQAVEAPVKNTGQSKDLNTTS